MLHLSTFFIFATFHSVHLSGYLRLPWLSPHPFIPSARFRFSPALSRRGSGFLYPLALSVARKRSDSGI